MSGPTPASTAAPGPAAPAPPAVCLHHAIADDARHLLDAMAPAGLQAVAFTPGGGWVIAAAPGSGGLGHAARGIPDACFVKLGEFIGAGHAVRSIAFAPAAADALSAADIGWVIVTDRAYFASGIPGDCFAALADAWQAGRRPTCIALGLHDGGWLLLAGREVRGRGVPSGCWQRLENLAQGLRPARQAAFSASGGWVIVADDRVTAHGLPVRCAEQIAQIGQRHVVEPVAFAPEGGWVVASSHLKTPRPVDPLRELEDRFRLVNGRWRSLDERLATHGAHGVCVVRVTDGAIDATCGYGAAPAGVRDAVLSALTAAAGAGAAVDRALTADDGRHLRVRLHPLPVGEPAGSSSGSSGSTDLTGFAVGVEGGDARALADELTEALVRVAGRVE